MQVGKRKFARVTVSEAYEVYAIKYAHHARRAAEHFIGGDPHDAPMPMDYFVWPAARGASLGRRHRLHR